jgi:hypothetical protein
VVSGKFYKNLSMKCWNSAFDAQGWRIVLQVGAVKIHVTAVEEALRQKERQE